MMKKIFISLLLLLAFTAAAQAQAPKAQNTKELWIENGSRRIFGELFTPQNAKANGPVAIIAHGFNGTFDFGRNYFDVLGRKGYHCYTFDFPCGSVRSRSDNNTLNMSILDEVSDVKAIVNHFRKQGHQHIVLIGESQGGLVSALTAAELKDEVSQLVLVFPALCIPDNWRQRYPRVEDIQDVTELWGVKMGRRFFEEIHEMSAFDIIGRYRGPVLIVQGDADRVVSLDDSRRAQQLYRPGTRLHIIPGAGHGFKPNEFQQEMEQLEQFLQADYDFVKGADVGFLTGQERRGVVFHDRNGRERECLELLKNDYQMSAIRMRVWVNPRGGDCDKFALLAMAKRVKALGMDLMVDFHYADSWADPAKQPIPKAWQGHSFEQMKQDLRDHTVEVLSLLKDNGIAPRWVQVGNETANGLLWPMGHIEQNPEQYAGFIRAGYDAVKEVFPEAVVIVHLDRGHKQSLYDWNLDTVLKYGGKFDMIGMSLYPYWAMEGHPELNADDIITDCIANIRHCSEKYGCDVMIVETGFEVDEQHPEKMEEGRRQLERVIREARRDTNSRCRGVFYWEPQCLPGGYKLGAFNSKAAPTAIMEGFVEKQ
jgi:arabinogalactan endo-1,4-beta-galactosidase